MILFLDFDGVLHPEYIPSMTPGRFRANPDHFSMLPAFEAVLREFTSLQVVISSTWRLQRSLDELKAVFSEELQHRIVGITPTVPRGGIGSRQREIEGWMEVNGEGRRWIAIDDRPTFFDRDCSNVFFTDTFVGLDDQTTQRLRHWIREQQGKDQ
jgi:HAD domain in Swiss Army Knife RNA repair proteins